MFKTQGSFQRKDFITYFSTQISIVCMTRVSLKLLQPVLEVTNSPGDLYTVCVTETMLDPPQAHKLI